MSSRAYAGVCRTCKGDLVQVITDGKVARTYHPWYSTPDGCSALLPFTGTAFMSSTVPDDQFSPDVI